MRIDLTLDLAELFAYTRDIFDAIRLVNPVDDSVVSKEDVANESLVHVRVFDAAVFGRSRMPFSTIRLRPSSWPVLNA